MLGCTSTFGAAAAVAQRVGADFTRVDNGADKLAHIQRLGAETCAAIGNGANDAAMLARAALGLAVVGPEGAHRDALAACDIAVRSILEALDLLLEPRALLATLRHDEHPQPRRARITGAGREGGMYALTGPAKWPAPKPRPTPPSRLSPNAG